MRRLVALAVLLLASLANASNGPPNAPPSCPAGTSWTRTYSQLDPDVDPWIGTTTAVYYSVTAPCWVQFDSDFVITATIRDLKCNNLAGQADAAGYTVPITVGNRWNITDTALDTGNVTTIAGARVNGASGYAAMQVGLDGTWVTTVRQHYGPAGAPTNHRIGFTFLPRVKGGCYVSGMNWTPGLVGTVTYDPYGPSTVDPPVDATTDPIVVPTTDPLSSGAADGMGGGTGGCGSSGATPALLGLVALTAAAWPRRRRPRS
jgi:hypothetical protein